MSNKKNRNRKTASETVGANKPTVALSNKPVTIDSSCTGGLLVYLKAHLWLVAAVCFLALGTLGAGLKYLDELAQREIAKRAANKNNLDNRAEKSILNRVNPFLPAPNLPPVPQLSKEYLYAGSRLLAVEDANAVPPADLAVWRPSSGVWWVMAGTNSQQVTQSWGTSGDDPVEGDYDGDGKTDFAVFRPDNPATPTVNECQNNCQWYVIYSSTGATIQFGFGAAGDKAVPADYDGDGKTDVAVFRNSNATWYINYSSNQTTVFTAYGVSGDKPAPADFDGDGRADLTVFRASSGRFYSLGSANPQTTETLFGAANDLPVSADYDGDGRADLAVWRSSSATWYIKQSSDNATQMIQFGIGTDKPVHNDYDGDGKVDLATWRNANGNWYIRKSGSNGALRQEQWGQSGDIPIPAYYRR